MTLVWNEPALLLFFCRRVTQVLRVSDSVGIEMLSMLRMELIVSEFVSGESHRW